MKKSIYITFFVFVMTFTTNAQVLSQDREGFSTIVTPSATFNLDLESKNANLSFYRDIWKRGDQVGPTLLTTNNAYQHLENTDASWGSYTYDQKVSALTAKLKTDWNSNEQVFKHSGSIHNHWILGVDLKGGAKEGVSTLFSGDQVSASASVGGLVGYRTIRRKYRMDKAEALAKVFLSFEKSKTVDTEIDTELNVLLKNGALNKVEKGRLVDYREEKTSVWIIEAIKAYKARLTPAFLKEQLDKNKKIVTNKLEGVSKLKTEANTIIKLLSAYNLNLANDPSRDYSAQEQSINTSYASYLAIYETYKGVKGDLVAKILLLNSYDIEEWRDVRSELDGYETKQGINLATYQNTSVNYDKLLGLYDDVVNQNTTSDGSVQNVDDVRNASYSDVETLYYARVSYTGSEFLLDLKNDSTTVDTRFQEVNLQGYKLELGATRRFRDNHFIGFSGAMSYTSNLNELKSGTFTLKKTDTTITGGSLSSSQTIESLTGDFDRFLRFDINADYIYFFPLKNNSVQAQGEDVNAFFLGINPYIRHRMYTNSEDIKPHTVGGIGLHTYSTKDNKLMGGLFIQSEDLLGKNADMDSTFRKRINFGVIVKFAIDGFKPKG